MKPALRLQLEMNVNVQNCRSDILLSMDCVLLQMTQLTPMESADPVVPTNSVSNPPLAVCKI